MNVLIVEDEPLAVAQLTALITALRPNTQIVGVCDTVKTARKWIEENPLPDLAFFDIQLGDGLSFELFAQTSFAAPIIFTTAYNEFAIQAFKVNSIDYLLKPLDKDELRLALDKFDRQTQTQAAPIPADLIAQLQKNLVQKNYKKRFVVRVGTRLRTIDIADVLYFYSFEKATYMKTTDGKNHLLDQTLEIIEEQIDPSEFFRINRKYLVHLKAITDVFTYSNSRYKLKVNHAEEDDFLVAREKAKAFKSWLEGES